MTEYTYDLAVVGCGGAGIAAALRASELGRRVLMIEKDRHIGGCSAIARGLGAVGSAEQKAASEAPLTVAELTREFQRQTCYLSDNALIHRFLAASGHTIDWLRENGCELTFCGTIQRKHEGDPFKTYFLWGPEKIKDMKRFAALVGERGGKLMLNATVSSILMEDGCVTGLRGTSEEGEFVARCPAVVLATGGFGDNEEMILRATGGVKVNRINTRTQTGDGIRLGVDAGGDTVNLHSIEYHGISLPYDKTARHSVRGTLGRLGHVLHLPTGLWVNRRGARFVGEDIVGDASYVANAAVSQGDCFYALYDGGLIQTLCERGTGALGLPELDGPLADPTPWTTLPRELEEGRDCGYVYRGDTVEDLAAAIGISPSVLAETLAEYNADCAAGCDRAFGKDAAYMRPLTTAPFYAVEARAAELCSLGSLRVDLSCAVLRKDGTPIRGLFAGGCDASGGLFNNGYVSLEGMTLGWSFTSGYIAGESAAAVSAGHVNNSE